MGVCGILRQELLDRDLPRLLARLSTGIVRIWAEACSSSTWGFQEASGRNEVPGYTDKQLGYSRSLTIFDTGKINSVYM